MQCSCGAGEQERSLSRGGFRRFPCTSWHRMPHPLAVMEQDHGECIHSRKVDEAKGSASFWPAKRCPQTALAWSFVERNRPTAPAYHDGAPARLVGGLVSLGQPRSAGSGARLGPAPRVCFTLIKSLLMPMAGRTPTVLKIPPARKFSRNSWPDMRGNWLRSSRW